MAPSPQKAVNLSNDNSLFPLLQRDKYYVIIIWYTQKKIRDVDSGRKMLLK